MRLLWVGFALIFLAVNVFSQPCEIPDKPNITTTGLGTETPVLTSSSEIGNTWFLNGEPAIEGTDVNFYPSLSGIYSVQVTVPGGCQSEMSDPVTIVVKPIIYDFMPESGPIGTTVTINGYNFDPVFENNIVFFGATEAVVADGSVYHLIVTVPPGAIHQPITVLSKGLQSYSRKPFTVTFDGIPGITTNSFVYKKTVAEASSVAGGDLDGDGKVDLVVINAIGSIVSVLRNSSSGPGSIRFADKTDVASGLVNARSVLIGDLDGDGKLDLALVSAFGSNRISVLRNTSSGAGSISFEDTGDFITGSDPRSGFIGDIDLDGRSDLVVANTNSNTLSILLNTSNGTGNINFASKVDLAVGRNPHYISLGDLDGNYRDDLIFRNGVDTVSLFQNTNGSIIGDDINFPEKQNFTAGQLIRAISICEIDGDGKPDLVVANQVSNTISVLRNITTPPTSSPGNFSIDFDDKMNFSAGEDPLSVSASDLDGDGKIDLAIGTLNQTVSLLRNTSIPENISFSANVDLTVESAATAVYISDLDGDGKHDLAIVDGSVLSIFRNNILSVSGPNINSFHPTGGAVGTSVTITGTNFDPLPENNIVKFNGALALVTACSENSITVTVPDGASSGPIAVMVGTLEGGSIEDFTVCTIPDTPVITVTGLGTENPILTSSSDDGNQWFLDGILMAGQTEKTIEVDFSGTYTVQVIVPGGCVSAFSDGFIFTITDITSYVAGTVSIYPNPTSGRVTFQVESNNWKTVSLYDGFGKLVERGRFEGSGIDMDLTQYENGIYFFVMSSGKRTISGKILKK